MKFPELHGIIRRRILVNFRAKPEIIERLLPAPLKPKVFSGWSVAGICLIKLEQIRPNWLTVPFGLNSENAAHRIAVCWQDKFNQLCEGVYIPRRDSSSLINQIGGGRLFPGEHRRAKFIVHDDTESVDIHVRGLSDSLTIDVAGKESTIFPSNSIFSDLNEVSRFFQQGSLGYSETRSNTSLDGIKLVTSEWIVKPFAIQTVSSSYFEDEKLFPAGSIEFDNALVMRNIKHQWQAAPALEISKSCCNNF